MNLLQIIPQIVMRLLMNKFSAVEKKQKKTLQFMQCFTHLETNRSAPIGTFESMMFPSSKVGKYPGPWN